MSKDGPLTFGGLLNGRFTFERIHNTKEQIIFYERAEKHKSKERTILSFKRALFPGNDQSGNNEIGKWLKHLLGIGFFCPSDVGDSFSEDVHNVCHCRKITAIQNMQSIYLNLNHVTSHSKFPPEMGA